MENGKLKLTLLKGSYGVCRLSHSTEVPDWALKSDFFSITKTSDELSILCPEDSIPKDVKCEKNWKVLKVLGPLDFSLVGILSSISTALAKNGISIFAVSTYDTDYILVKSAVVDISIGALINEGYEVTR